MKKFVFLLLFIVIGSFLIIFTRPDLIVNKSSVEFVLNQTKVFKKWSWKEADFRFAWNEWNNRSISGSIDNFCFDYESESLNVKSCLEKVTWDFKLLWSWKDGFSTSAIKPFHLLSSQTTIHTKDQKNEDDAPPPPIWKYWKRLWAGWIPPLNLNFEEIKIISEKDPLIFNLNLQKKENHLLLEMLKFKLEATPDKIVIQGPQDFIIPSDIKTKKPLRLNNMKLIAFIKEKGISLDFSGDMEGFILDGDSYIDLPLKGNFSSLDFRKNLFLKTTATLSVKDLKGVIHSYIPEPYDELPAPLNVMNGSITLNLKTRNADQEKMILIETGTHINLQGEKQALDLTVRTDIPLNVMDFSRGLIQVGIDFSKVIIQLPRLSKKSPPPQFLPDSRFKTEAEIKNKPLPSKNSKLSFDLEALNNKALHIRSNLLDEPLRLNFNLQVQEGEVKDGFVKILPLETTVFKRPVLVKELLITFDTPKPPLVEGVIKFPLPEYNITMKLEGPVSDPQYAFSSSPPLPQNDIYAVLLFGRPLADLGPEDKNAAQQTNQILAQGILSLTVLYFLAGSPVEYIGYDPESKRATAQIGLGKRSSLRVGAGAGGGVTGVRRSLGKGWYLDTSVQNTSNPANKGVRNYGVLLERIIAY